MREAVEKWECQYKHNPCALSLPPTPSLSITLPLHHPPSLPPSGSPPIHHPYLAWFGFNIQLLDTLPRNKGLCRSPTEAAIGGGMRAALQALKEAVLFLVASGGAEGDSLHLGGRSHVQLVLDGAGAGFVGDGSGWVFALLLLGGILQEYEQ